MRENATSEFIGLVKERFHEPQSDQILQALDLVVRRGPEMAKEAIPVARLVIEHFADHFILSAMLLTPLRRSGGLTRESIVAKFGETLADLVESVHRQELLRTDSEENRRDDLGALLNSFTGDIRSAVLQVGNRLFVLENSRSSPEEILALATETMELYVPLADRLGMGAIRSRLEDVCFRILEPDLYASLERAYEPIHKQDNIYLELLISGMQGLLSRNHIKASVWGRTKGLYSLYRKMRRYDLPLERVTDIIALRIIVSSVPECYSVLGLLHTHFRPIPDKFRDYIGAPKDNGYQSLHTCIYPVTEISDKAVEIQVRTQAMHAEAEFGVASHWYYKNQRDTEAEHTRHLEWFRSLTEEHRSSAGHSEFLDRLKNLVYSNEIVVFSSRGERVRLPYRSSVRGFAEGLGCATSPKTIVHVNGKTCDLDTTLNDGDTVELTPFSDRASPSNNAGQEPNGSD